MASGSTAASAALADAGIEMLGLVAGCSAAVYSGVGAGGDSMDVDREEGNDVWLDPNEQESKAATGMLMLACMPALGSVTNVRQTGTMSVAQVSSVRFTFSHLLVRISDTIHCSV